MPRRPCVPRTIRSAGHAAACSTMTSHGRRAKHSLVSVSTGTAAASSEELLSLANPLLEMQRAQWAAWQSWQQSLATFHRDFWEQCAVRFAGGLPFDG